MLPLLLVLVQEQQDVWQSDKLAVPADTNPAAFYISNLWNDIYGNAAVGGWSGYSLVNFPQVIGPQRDLDPNFIPTERPTKLFWGNSAHSTGYWSTLAAGIYSGGFLEEDHSNGGVYRIVICSDGFVVYNMIL